MAFFRLLSAYKHVDALGKCMHNMGDQDSANAERFKARTVTIVGTYTVYIDCYTSHAVHYHTLHTLCAYTTRATLSVCSLFHHNITNNN
jgi:hypothetical protein